MSQLLRTGRRTRPRTVYQTEYKLDDNVASLSLQGATRMAAWQDFGQRVSLTARIREILSNYPEGTSIFKELFQNADDAGATTVKLCLDHRTHGTGSVAFEGLAEFQGPSLLCYNDALFKESDFESISRIGDSIKRVQAGKTGRFGVGFNACYHLSEIPQFVSGRHLVMFDPHCQYLPNISALNPGKKIDFVAGELALHHPDQCAPFRAFDCDMTHEFQGTLFRFPLRTQAQAERSQISKAATSPARIAALLADLRTEAHLLLLFLKNVERLEVLQWEQEEEQPQMMFSCAVRGVSKALRWERGLFGRASRAVAAELAESHAAQAPGSPGGNEAAPAGPSPPKLTQEEEALRQQLKRGSLVCGDFVLELETVLPPHAGLPSPGSVTGPPASEPSRAEVVVRRYMLAQGCCGVPTAAWRLAEEGSAQQGSPLVPWGALALPLDSEQPGDYAGQAFCFLPLPVQSGLPAHINATFELSSNRRDIWSGRDMVGAGRRRALWNEALLAEAVAPLLALALEKAAQRLGPSDAYWRLWPTSLTTVASKEAFAALVEPLCVALASAAVAYSSVSGGRWMPPTRVLFPDDRTARDSQLCDALLAAGLPLATMPQPVMRLLLQHLPQAPALLSPTLVRSHLRANLQAQRTPQQAAALLAFCMGDLDESDPASTAELDGLVLLPLSNGQVAGFGGAPGQAGAGGTVYVPTPKEVQLFAASGGRLLLDTVLLPGDLVQRLRLMASLGHLNLRCIDVAAVRDLLLPLALPASWRGRSEVRWQQAAAQSSLGSQQQPGPASDWLCLLWVWLAEQGPDGVVQLLAHWPLLPTSEGSLLGPRSLGESPALLLPGEGEDAWAEGLQSAATKLGCRLVDTTITASGPAVHVAAHVCDGRGLLACMHAVLKAAGDFSVLFDELGLTPSDRRALRGFLLQPLWFQGSRGLDTTAAAGQRVRQQQQQQAPGEEIDAVLLGFLRRLPLYELVVEEGGAPRFTDLRGERFLPPADLPQLPGWEEVLDTPVFVAADTPSERAVLSQFLGVHQLSRAELYRGHVLPRLALLSSGGREAVMVEVLQELMQLQRADPQFAKTLSSLKFVSTPGGGVAAPAELYDPRSAALLLLLDPTTDFPSPAFAPVLPALQQLGMKAVAEPSAVLRSARAIESLAAAQPEQAVSRGRALLAYLELEAPRLALPAEPVSAGGGGGGAAGQDGPAFHLDRFFSRMSGFLRGPDEGHLPGLKGVGPAAGAKGGHSFWQALASIAWCPVLAQPPVAGMPWLHSHQPVAPPANVRPPADTWLASATMLILNGECRSSLLTDVLGWSQPLPCTTVASQLAALGVCHAASTHTATRQLLAGVVPQLYSALAALPKAELSAVREQLEGSNWVWVGDGFMPVNRVAFRGPLNLSPWLYVIPLELAPFKDLLGALGVPPSFTAQQYRQVLESMAKETGGKQLSEQQLEQSLAIIAVLADMELPPGEAMYLPNERGVLTEATKLTFNDAPWLPSSSEGVLFVHPKIANDVAERLGVASLRRSLLVRSADSIQLGLAGTSMEAFGQSEALTTRLRHIIQAYADGPGILMELLQNADDAGASRVCFLLDLTSYPTASLLGPRMAPWQGPALLCFNDSVFSPSDFHAIARIGQDGKLARPATTGRFGLGFNAVYHFTDVPSFLSTDYLVFFDPHAKYLPGVNAAQPGLKINFAGSALAQQFPDSVAPYLHFGCTMSQPFNGTLFRFPLRTEALAAESDIKPEAYFPSHVMALFESFTADAAAEVLLFLKSVRSLELLVKHSADEPPRQLLSVSLASATQQPQQAVAEYVRGSSGGQAEAGRGGSGAEFSQRLGAAGEGDLPCVCSRVTVSMQRGVSLAPAASRTALAMEGAAGGQEGPGGGSVTEGSGGDSANREAGVAQVQQWLVCSMLAGGRARRMALESAQGGAKGGRGWVPWAGAAAPIAPPLQLAGRAFCFLPLPTATGLPLHINGAFELSSNRRDLWTGSDLAGSGKKMALWNAALLADGVAPAYVQVLLAAARQLGPCPSYYSLWPLAPHLTSLWALVADRVLDLAVKQPLLWSAAGEGRWVTPAEAILLPPTPEHQASAGASVGEVSRLLLLEGLPLVTEAPPALVQGLLRRHPDLSVLSPALVRRHLRGRAPSSISCLAAPPAGHRPPAAVLLAYCLSGLDIAAAPPAELAAEVEGLPLLPLLDEGTAVLQSRGGAAPLYLATPAQQRLLSASAPTSLLAVPTDSTLGQQLAALSAALPPCNVRVLDVPALATAFLSRMLPHTWKGQRVVSPWLPGEEGQPSLDTLSLVWGAVAEADSPTASQGQHSQALAALAEWPLIQALGPGGEASGAGSAGLGPSPLQTSCLCAPSAAAQLVEQGSWAGAVSTALGVLGCHLVDPRAPALQAVPGWVLQACVQRPTGAGTLAAIAAGWELGGGKQRAEQLGPGERDALRAFLLQARWFEGDGGIAPELLPTLRALPIYRRACGNAAPLYSDLARPAFLAPRTVPSPALPPSFVLPSDNSEADLLAKHLGVTRLSRVEVMTRHVLPRAGDLTGEALLEAVLPLIKQMGSSPQGLPGAVRDSLRSSACVPTSAGGRCQPGQLYDPRNHDLRCLLGSSRTFPSEEWASQAGVLEGLAALGMRTSLSPQVLLEVAQSIEEEAARLSTGDGSKEELVERARALLSALASLSAAQPAQEALVPGTQPAVAQDSALDVASTPLVGDPELQPGPSRAASPDPWPPKFWSQLSVLAFVPVHATPPCEGLPWPSGTNLAVAPPKLVRPEASMWLVSGSMRLMMGSCPDHLAARFGWLDRPPVSVLAGQLLELGRLHGAVADPSLRAILHSAVGEVYSLLGSPDWVGGGEGEVAKVMLEGAAWVWTGEGFRGVGSVALDSPADFRPFLFTVPEDLMQHQPLFTWLGVPATPTLQQYSAALAALAAQAREEALGEEALSLATALAESCAAELADRPSRPAAAGLSWHLPDISGIMGPATSCHFDDAPWLGREGLRMVHPSIPAEVAQALGAQSLRYHHQVDTQMTSTLPCPPAALVRELLQKQQDTGLLALLDVVEVADACGCSSLEFWLDTLHYPAHTLLLPQLAAFQGPAILVRMSGIVLSADEVCRLQAPTTPFRLRMSHCIYGTGLMAGYVLTDLPLVLAGDSMLLADPVGIHLSASGGARAGAGSSSPGSTPGSGLVKMYRHAVSDLPLRFADQFAVWQWAGQGGGRGARLEDTLLRLPLRTEEQAELPTAVSKLSWTVDAASSLLSQLAATLPQCLLFLRSLRTIRIMHHTSAGGQLVHEATLGQAPRSPPVLQGATPPAPSHRVWVEEREWKPKAVASSSRGSPGGLLGRLARMAGGSSSSSSRVSPAPAPEEGVLRHTQHEVVVRTGEGHLSSQHWAVTACAAAGQSAQLAAQLQLSPQAAVAVRLDSAAGALDLEEQGQCGSSQGPAVVAAPGLLATLPLPVELGLARMPCTLCAPLVLARSGGRRPFTVAGYGDGGQGESPADPPKARLNLELMRCAALAYVGLLERLLQEHRGGECRGLYSMLPRFGPPESCDADTAFLVQQIYMLAAGRAVWQVRAGELSRLSAGCFLDAGEAASLAGPARAFVERAFPLFHVPAWVRWQLEACGVAGLRTISPPVVRDLLKRMAAEGRLNMQHFSAEAAADLLHFATSDVSLQLQGGDGDAEEGAASPLDLDALRACQGLPYVSAAGSVRLLGVDRALVCDGALLISPLGIFTAVADDFLHETLAAALRSLLSHPQVAAILHVERYSMASAIAQLAAVLPSHWTPPAIGRHAPLSVSWRDGQMGGPSPDWLSRLWELLLALQPDRGGPAWDLLAGFALLPCTSGEVVRMAHRHVVITPPLQPAATSAPLSGAGAGPDELADGEQGVAHHPGSSSPVLGDNVGHGVPQLAEPWDTQLALVLARMGCFVLDPRFASACSPICNAAHAYGQAGQPAPAQEEQLVVKKMRATAELGRLQPTALDAEDRQVLLNWLASSIPATHGAALQHADVDFLRTLPIFPALSGDRIPLHPTPGFDGATGVCTEEDVVAVFGSLEAVPTRLKARLLASQPQQQGLYGLLGAPLLLRPALLVEALGAVGFVDLPEPAQVAAVLFMESSWGALKQDARAMEALRSIPFVQTGAGELAAPSSLYDPAHPLLSVLFAGQAHMFPGSGFATPAWLARLRELGLKRAVDAEAALAAALSVASTAQQVAAAVAQSGDSALPAGGWQASGSCLVLSGEPGQRLSGRAAEVWQAACTLAGCLSEGSAESSALLGPATSRAFVEELRQVPFAPCMLFTPGIPVWQPALARYSDAIALKDWALAWSAAPVLHGKELPPASAWSLLRLRSPPPFDTIVQHLGKVGADHGELALSAWPSAGGQSPEQACQLLLKHLDDEGLSSAQRARLEGLAIVPVANATRLAAPRDLYVRLPLDLAPFLFELPPELVGRLELLKGLGTRESPSAPELLDLLSGLRAQHATRPLNSSQLRAVVRLLSHLLDNSSAPVAPQTRQALAAGQLAVPTPHSLLAPARQCLYASTASSRGIVARLPADSVTLAHPLLPTPVCKALGMRPLHEAVQEQADPAHPPQPIAAIQGLGVSELASRLQHPRFAAAVHEVLRSAGGAGKSEEVAAAEVSQLSQGEVEARLSQAASDLRLVRECWTRLVLHAAGGATVLDGSSAQVPYFVSPAGGPVLVADLPPGTPLSASLAAATSRLLLGSTAPCLPLGPLFECSIHCLASVAGITTGAFRSSSVPEGGAGRPQAAAAWGLELTASAGQLGTPLTPADSSALRLRPLRPFAAGELVAHQAAPSGQLQYGRVAADSRPPPSAAAYRVTVEVAPGVFRDLLSSQLYCLGDCAAPEGAAGTGAGQGTTASTCALPLSGPAAAASVSHAQSQAPGIAVAPSPAQAPAPVAAAELVRAARSMLAVAGVPLGAGSTGPGELAEEVAALQQQLQGVREQLAQEEERRHAVEAAAEGVRDSWKCRICLTHEVDHAFASCGHLICEDCVKAMPRQGSCPFCRRQGRPVKLFK